jgi:hypothetical protein
MGVTFFQERERFRAILGCEKCKVCFGNSFVVARDIARALDGTIVANTALPVITGASGASILYTTILFGREKYLYYLLSEMAASRDIA